MVGNEYMLSTKKVSISDNVASNLQSWKAKGKSVALAAINFHQSTTWHLVCTFAISDPIRPEAVSIIRALRSRGTDVWMLSGDNQITANAIGAQVGILPTNGNYTHRYAISQLD